MSSKLKLMVKGMSEENASVISGKIDLKIERLSGDHPSAEEGKYNEYAVCKDSTSDPECDSAKCKRCVEHVQKQEGTR